MYVHRYIRIFSKADKSLVTEIPLSRFSLPDFQKQFGVKSDDPMYDSYPLLPKHTAFIQGFLQETVQWDFESYSYLVDAEACC